MSNLAVVCPETHQALTEAPRDLLEQLNQSIETGKIRNRAGDLVHAKMSGALVRDDGQILYPIVDGIAKMIVDEAITLQEES